jgi:hypothetical protein
MTNNLNKLFIDGLMELMGLGLMLIKSTSLIMLDIEGLDNV